MTDPYENRGGKALVMLFGPLSTIVVVVFACWSAATLFRARRLLPGVWSLLLGLFSVASWWGVVPAAQRWSGWSDPDRDGVFADFTNGAYDSVDWYGGHWGVLVFGVASVCGIVLIIIRRWGRTRGDSRRAEASR